MFDYLVNERIDTKPRSQGLTCVTDRLYILDEDNLRVLAPFIDIVKIQGSLALLMQEEILHKRINLYHRLGIRVMLGSSISELAILKGSFERLVHEASKVGFDIVEVGENSIDLSISDKEKIRDIVRSKELEFIWKVGKRDPRRQLSIESMLAKIDEAVRLGSRKVILEANQGYNVGIYDEKGLIKWSIVSALTSKYDPLTFIFEAPLESQQYTLIAEFGERVNLAEVTFKDVISIETQRRGFIPRIAFTVPYLRKNPDGGPAVKFIYYIISTKHPIDQSEIMSLTHLSRRTVQNAIEELKRQGLIVEQNSLDDARKRVYYPIKSEWL
mgnify:CR=1 FL=1